ncbi:unnamed protein product [Candidula unifasciata]|uniref:Uncharacterized protein n=1 Tax=Candidula unifasciata TaxID=100452 RepID=A0A8S4A2U2_9EUPU|nr:unnamed protein product [Candidula unifasciata]
MATSMRFSFSRYSNYIRSRLPVRRFSTTRRLMSQHWQQEGVPGSNLPFSIKNKYWLTFLTTVYFASALNAPFILLAITLKRIYTPQVELGTQVLSTKFCVDEAEED